MVQGIKSGVITHLRAVEGEIFGPPGDQVDGEVFVVLDNAPGWGFVLQLRNRDQLLVPKLAMFSLLREAYIRGLKVAILYFANKPENRNVFIHRVVLEKGL